MCSILRDLRANLTLGPTFSDLDQPETSGIHFGRNRLAQQPREGSTAVCSRCHLPAPGYDQLAERRFEFIPLWGFLVFLLYTMRRVDCRRCGVVAVEEVPWGDGKRTLTKAYMLFLTRWARRLSWKETAGAFRTSLEEGLRRGVT